MEEETKEKLENEMDKYSEDEEVIALYSAYPRDVLERNTIIKEAKIAKEELAKSKEDLAKSKEELVKIKEELTETKKTAKEATYNNSTQIARNLLKKKLDIDFISEVTGLNKEEIEKL